MEDIGYKIYTSSILAVSRQYFFSQILTNQKLVSDHDRLRQHEQLTKRYLETDAMFREAIDFSNNCIIHTPGAEKHMLQLIEIREASRQAHLAVHGDFGTISLIEAEMSNVSSLTDEIAVEENTHTTTTEATINDNHTNDDDSCFSVSSTEFHTQPKAMNDIHKFAKI